MYVRATSTRKIEKIAAKFGVESLSRDQVSRLCAVIDGQVDAFLSKDWSALRFAYLFLDATYVKCQDAGHVRSEAFITAIGIGDDGLEKKSAKQHALAVMAPIFKESDPALVRALTTKL